MGPRSWDREEKSVGSKAVVAGGANMDIQGWPRNPFIPGDSNPGTIRSSPGGVGRNVAENLARLGVETRLLTVLGADADGKFLEADCAAKGVDLGLSLRSRLPSPRYLCLLDSRGDLLGAIADMDAMDLLTWQALEERKESLDGADFLVLDANLPAASLEWLAGRYGRSARARRRAAGPFLAVDPVSETKASRLKGIFGEFDLAKPNMAEARLLAGLEEGGEDPREIRKALEATGRLPGELFISLGSKGLYGFDSSGETIQALPAAWDPGRTVNRSGAGDALLAALLWSGSMGWSLEKRCRLALAAALLTSTTEHAVLGTLSGESLERAEAELFGSR